MIRLFAALDLPEPVAESLMRLQSGVPGARWQTREQLHLTLRFIGEVDGRDAASIDDMLSAIHDPRFTLELKGVGEFGGKNPRALWAGAAPNEALKHLQRKIETALQRLGLPPEERKYHAACHACPPARHAPGRGDGFPHRSRALCERSVRGAGFHACFPAIFRPTGAFIPPSAFIRCDKGEFE